MIIDSHVHYGYSKIFDSGVKEKSIITSMEINCVDISILQPLPVATLEEATILHKGIYKLSKKYPKKIFGIASVNPNLPEKEVVLELERCIKEYGFVGIKCHTIGHSVNPLSKSGDLLFKSANKLGVAINVHSGNGIVFASPSLNIIKAREYPELKIVIAHSGMQILTAEAFVAAKECKNIFLETSWTPAEDIEWLVNALGSQKIMMGSDIFNDSCYNQHIELEKYKIINLTSEERDNCLYRTAGNVFNLNLNVK